MKTDLVVRLVNPASPRDHTPQPAWNIMDQVSPRTEMNWRSVGRVVHLEMIRIWEWNGATEGGVSWRRRV